jgi:hypothetical protein
MWQIQKILQQQINKLRRMLRNKIPNFRKSSFERYTFVWE